MRTTIVSTAKLKNYRTVVFIIDGIVLISIIFLVFYMYAKGGHFISSIMPFIIYLQFHIYYGLFLKLKNVSYDDSSVYYNRKGYEVQVPFENIKSIEIKSVTGVYSISLFVPSHGQTEILFKASLWYPLNFQKKDALVNDLRDKVDLYQRAMPGKIFKGLPSYNF